VRAWGWPPFTSTFAIRLRVALTLRCIPFTSVRFRDDEELRDAPDAAEALSALFAEKIRVIDARMAELAALRADFEERVATGCPLRAAGLAG